HKDIAFQFGMWISPKFQLLLIKEYQRLKEAENSPLQLQWNVHRILSKVNYRLHTDAIKTYIIPKSDHQQWQYAEEADLLNLAILGCTAKEWQTANPSEALKGLNLRDVATIAELIVLVNVESYNAQLIKDLVPKGRRFMMLQKMAQEQLSSLSKLDVDKNFRAITGTETKQLKEQ
ncbi:MAG: KilA-N domain-containing protein, partial [Mucinivorans sp.]